MEQRDSAAVTLAKVRRGIRNSAWGGLELATAFLLAAGAVLLPVVGPLVGLGLLWWSAAWTATEKVVATVVLLTWLVVLLGCVLAGAGAETTVAAAIATSMLSGPAAAAYLTIRLNHRR